MIEREDFFSLFFSSVEKYYKEALDKEIEFSFTSKLSECNAVIKPKLSAVVSVHMSSKAREFFYAEWNIRNSIIKNIIAKTYVFLMTRTGRLFSQFKFKFMPYEEFSDDIVIAPNNRSIRIFDYATNIVGCIKKEGFTNKYFENQLSFRKQYHYDFMFPLLKYGDDWFQEPIMYGHPLARVTDNQRYKKGISDVIEDIKALAFDTIEYIDSDEYVRNLVLVLEIMLERARIEKEILNWEKTEEIIRNIHERIKSVHIMMPTCISHGDLQTGNIWLDRYNKTWIYDWETVGRRSIWYDSSVLQYSLRRPEGWKHFLSIDEPVLSVSCDPCKTYDKREYSFLKDIILLEDLCFYLEDMLELPEKWGVEIFDAFIDRLQVAGL